MKTLILQPSIVQNIDKLNLILRLVKIIVWVKNKFLYPLMPWTQSVYHYKTKAERSEHCIFKKR